MNYPGMLSIPCFLMRGGSSKGGVFLQSDLPTDPAQREALLLAAYGSPDARQIDGLGGSDPLTSKAAVVGRSSRADADLDYTFYQIGIESARVSTGGTCGNMLAAVAPFGLLCGLIPEPLTGNAVVARIHATNTGQVFTARFRAEGRFALVDGDSTIAGVPGNSSSIRIDFGDCAGAVSGKLLPTGNERDVLVVDGHSVHVSLVDAATPFVFVRAADIGAKGNESPSELLTQNRLMQRLEVVRAWAARALDLVENADEAAKKSPNIPRVVMVSAPTEFSTINGEELEAADMDLCVRQLAMQKPHKALAVTGTVCTAVAARIRRSVVAECTMTDSDVLRIAHPSGITAAWCEVEPRTDGGYTIKSAEVERTARLIMQGNLLVRLSRYEEVLRSLAQGQSHIEELPSSEEQPTT